jgi:hypothetical protein
MTKDTFKSKKPRLVYTAGKHAAKSGELVEARGCAGILAGSGSRVATYDNSFVVAQGNSIIQAYDHSRVYAFNKSRIEAHDDTKVQASQFSSVVADGNARVIILTGKPTIEVRQGSNARVSDLRIPKDDATPRG